MDDGYWRVRRGCEISSMERWIAATEAAKCPTSFVVRVLCLLETTPAIAADWMVLGNEAWNVATMEDLIWIGLVNAAWNAGENRSELESVGEMADTSVVANAVGREGATMAPNVDVNANYGNESEGGIAELVGSANE